MRTAPFAVLLAAITAVCVAAPEGPPAMKWALKFEAAQAAAAESQKPIMLVLTSNRPSLCAAGPVAPDPFRGPKVIELSAKFECVRLDADKHATLTDKYRKFDFPVALFLDAKSELFYESMANISADAFVVRMSTALDAFRALPERRRLEAARKAGEASPEELARLGHLLLMADRDSEAFGVLNEALPELPQDAECRPQAELDKLIASASRGAVHRTAVLEWLAANPDHPRRWEAEHKLAMAQQKANAKESAVQSHRQVAQGTPESGWGKLSKHYAQAISDQIAYEANPPVG